MQVKLWCPEANEMVLVACKYLGKDGANLDIVKCYHCIKARQCKANGNSDCRIGQTVHGKFP